MSTFPKKWKVLLVTALVLVTALAALFLSYRAKYPY